MFTIDKKFHEKNLILAPVVITSQTHQPVGAPVAYPVHTGVHGGAQTTYMTAVTNPAMPMPYSDSAPYPTGPPMGGYPGAGNAPYPVGGNAPYPPAPYGQQPTAMYPPANSTPYPPTTAPYPNAPPQAMMNPPAYNEVVFTENHQKQAPYNPNFSG